MASRRSIKISTVLIALFVLLAGAGQLFAGKKPGGGCPTGRPGCFCATYYDPVVCDGGCTYSNICFANCAGATNCVPTGGGPVPVQ